MTKIQLCILFGIIIVILLFVLIKAIITVVQLEKQCFYRDVQYDALRTELHLKEKLYRAKEKDFLTQNYKLCVELDKRWSAEEHDQKQKLVDQLNDETNKMHEFQTKILEEVKQNVKNCNDIMNKNYTIREIKQIYAAIKVQPESNNNTEK